jgi:alkaline phosphatase D
MRPNMKKPIRPLPMLALILLLIVAHPYSIWAQQDLLQAGPMVGYSDMREVAVWIQLKQEGNVNIAYSEAGKQGPRVFTDTKSCLKSEAYTATLIADQVEPGTTYEYEVWINDKKIDLPYPLQFQTQSLWQWRTDAPDFSFAAGSCFYINEEIYDRPGTPYGADYFILESIYRDKPNFMMWLGDNVYLREADWNSRTGYVKRYTHTRSAKELQPLLGNTHHYAVWDDHDYGPNDSDENWKLKRTAEEVFNLFWPNPPTELDMGGGITNYFQWSDCDFFLLDDRYHKSPNSRPGTILGHKQLQWVKDMLKNSKASFKFVATGVMFLSTAPNKENFSKAGAVERAELIQFIQENNITGVIFISGDRHFAELSELIEPGKVPIYDFTTSALTAGPAAKQYHAEVNELRVEGTAYYQRNYGFIRVYGSKETRTVALSLKNSKGELLWEKVIPLSAFKK